MSLNQSYQEFLDENENQLQYVKDFAEDEFLLSHAKAANIKNMVKYLSQNTAHTVSEILVNALNKAEKQEKNIKDLNLKDKYLFRDRSYSFNNISLPEVSSHPFLPYSPLTSLGLSNRSYTRVFSILQDEVTLYLCMYSLELQSGEFLNVIQVSDLVVNGQMRNQGIGKEVNQIVEQVAIDNECDLIISQISADELQKKYIASKKKAGYTVFGNDYSIKAFSSTGEKVLKRCLENEAINR